MGDNFFSRKRKWIFVTLQALGNLFFGFFSAGYLRFSAFGLVGRRDHGPMARRGEGMFHGLIGMMLIMYIVLIMVINYFILKHGIKGKYRLLIVYGACFILGMVFGLGLGHR